jgi:uncharacterized pyridoxamine 5'-phosphate oxidase family protein
MNKKEILEFLNANPTCYLATSVNNKPYVRAMRMVSADEKGLIFQTVDGKDLPKQMMENPSVEVCFYNLKENVQVRIAGKATLLEDPELKKKIAEQRPFLTPLIEKKGFGVMPVFRIVDCVACTWTMATNFSAKEYIRF